MNYPLVSVIVTTKNSAAFLEACLRSIKNQTYEKIQLIVVDNYSTDNTVNIAKQYADAVFSKGPERSTQRNYGVTNSRGEFVLIIDSDMELMPEVVKSCVKAIKSAPAVAVIIPEESFGEGFWAQCKKLERSFYIGNNAIEAARFFNKACYEKLKGFDEQLISGEDWELSRRFRQIGHISRVNSFIRHNEGKLSLWNTLKKKYYYAGHAQKFLSKVKTDSKLKSESGPLQRYKLFFSQPKKLFENPLLGIGMLLMKTMEFGSGAIGYLMYK